MYLLYLAFGYADNDIRINNDLPLLNGSLTGHAQVQKADPHLVWVFLESLVQDLSIGILYNTDILIFHADLTQCFWVIQRLREFSCSFSVKKV